MRSNWEVMDGIGDSYLQTMCADVEAWKFQQARLPVVRESLSYWRERIADDIGGLVTEAIASDEIGLNLAAVTAGRRHYLAQEALNVAVFAQAESVLENTATDHEFGDEYRRARVTVVEPGIRLYQAGGITWRGIRQPAHREAEPGEEFFGKPVQLRSSPNNGGFLLLTGSSLYLTMDGIINTEKVVHPRIKLDWLAKA